ncbi:hypothetical protein [Nitrospirillum amazonense]|uniref:hypothetical protein n=1 Tax=Nitrospirillum amazonense TaxID=28077 RepID=UPI00241224D9|nr:hypothetical protein [Nitrospirillum amazonense]MDG3444599.1 hypothetical protein [Nitrospirillum amazonense]
MSDLSESEKEAIVGYLYGRRRIREFNNRDIIMAAILVAAIVELAIAFTLQISIFVFTGGISLFILFLIRKEPLYIRTENQWRLPITDYVLGHISSTFSETTRTALEGYRKAQIDGVLRFRDLYQLYSVNNTRSRIAQAKITGALQSAALVGNGTTSTLPQDQR